MQHKAVQLLTVISPSSDSSPSVSKPGSDAVGVDDDGSAVEELSPRQRRSGEATSLSASEESRPFFLGPHNSARLACLFVGKSDGWSQKTPIRVEWAWLAGVAKRHEKWGAQPPPPSSKSGGAKASPAPLVSPPMPLKLNRKETSKPT